MQFKGIFTAGLLIVGSLVLALLAGCSAQQGASDATGATGAVTASESGMAQTESSDSSTVDTSIAMTVADAAATATTADANFTFSDTGVSADVSDASLFSVDGTALTIKASGVYAVSGTCSEGSITVAKDAGDVTVILNGITLSSSTGNALKLKGGSTRATVTVAAGTENSLTSSDATNQNATISSSNALTIDGSGTLHVVNTQKNGIKADGGLSVAETTLDITATYKGISSDYDLALLSGTITVNAGNDGIHADGNLYIGDSTTGDGPEITVSQSYEGLEGNNVYVYGGTTNVTSTDDGVNAAGGTDTTDTAADDNFGRAMGGGMQNDSGHLFSMSGGTLTINAEGDGIDANGDIDIEGGTIYVYGASTSTDANTAIDYGTSFTNNGGTLVAIGLTGMMGDDSPSTGSQAYVRFSNVSLSAGSTIQIEDASGTEVYSGSAVKTASDVIFSSASITDGSTYTLLIDGSQAATATATTTSSTTGAGGQPQMGGQQAGSQAAGGQQMGAQPSGSQAGAQPSGSQAGGQPSGSQQAAA